MALKEISDFSKEQFDFLENSNAKVNICSGPVRSGKNFIENVRLAGYAKFEPEADPTSDLLFSGATKDSCYRIFLKDWFQILGPRNYKYDHRKGKGRVFDRDFYVFGFTNADDWESLRGATGGGGLATEVTLAHPDFINEMEARCSVDGAKLFFDTNPDSEFHYIHTDYIGNKEKLEKGAVKVFNFTFNSNLSLNEGYKEHLRLTYKPGTLLYKRLILGLWVAAEGVVYDSFDSSVNTCSPDEVPDCDEYVVSIDYGTSNPCVFLLIGRRKILPGLYRYYVVKEKYHNGREEGQKTNLEYVDDLLEFIEKSEVKHKIRAVITDPSAASLKVDIKKSNRFKATRIRLIDANNDVLEGIANVSSLYYQKLLVISRACVKTLAEIPKYIWDKNAQKRGEDKPLKQSDHCMDAKRYGLNTKWPAGTFGKGWMS